MPGRHYTQARPEHKSTESSIYDYWFGVPVAVAVAVAVEVGVPVVGEVRLTVSE